MTNKEYYASENKTVKEMMSDFSKSGVKSYDKWLDMKRAQFSGDISFITSRGDVVSAEMAYSGVYKLEYVKIENDILKRNNACFKVLLDDLDGETCDYEKCEWSTCEKIEDCIPFLEDGIFDGNSITNDVTNEYENDVFPAFSACAVQGGFLPTIFQFKQLWKFKDEISVVMHANGWRKPFGMNTHWWSSCQSSATYAWNWYSSGNWYGNTKTLSYYVLPFFAI